MSNRNSLSAFPRFGSTGPCNAGTYTRSISRFQLRRQKELPLAQLGRKHVNAFCSALKDKLWDRGSNFGKEYLKLLVDEIRVDKKEVRLSGSYAALAGALAMSTKPGVPSIVPVYLPSADKSKHGEKHPGFAGFPIVKHAA